MGIPSQRKTWNSSVTQWLFGFWKEQVIILFFVSSRLALGLTHSPFNGYHGLFSRR